MAATSTPFLWQVIFLNLWVSLFAYLPFCYLFYKNRHLHPIHARLPLFILFLDLCLFCASVSDLFLAIFPHIYNCTMRHFLNIPFMTGFTVYSYRLLHLLFANKITTITSNQNLDVDVTENFFIKFRWIVHSRSGFWIIFFQTGFDILVAMMISVLDGPNATELCTFKTQPQIIDQKWNIARNVVAFVIVLVLGFALRAARGDAFSIKKEFYINIYTSGLAVVLSSVCSFFVPSYVGACFDLLVCHSVIATGTVWPYFLSQHYKRLGKVSDGGDELLESKTEAKKNLMDVITTPEGYQLFLRYLETEFSTENLLFWQAVEQLKQLDPEAPTTSQRISDLYSRYIPENAPYQVNISDRDRKPLIQTITTLPQYLQSTLSEKSNFLHIFDSAQEVIYDLMSSDSFPRFLWTAEADRYFLSHSSLRSPSTIEDSMNRLVNDV